MAEDAGTPAARGQPTAGQPQAEAGSRRPSGQDKMSEGERRLLAAMPLHAITALHGEDPAAAPVVDSVREEAARERSRGIRPQAKHAGSTSGSVPWAHAATPLS